ncbi:MAG: Vacuolar protein sorting-associated protein 62 [Peltula sp. TS41687]|nr:MAG: Vacuolar protein sorting-associated protein 62 [Peltula sp. TS41687]
MHQGHLLSSLHSNTGAAASSFHLHGKVELAGIDDASNKHPQISASTLSQGLPASSAPFIETSPTSELTIVVETSGPSADCSSLIHIDLSNNRRADGVHKEQQRFQDIEPDTTGPLPSIVPLLKKEAGLSSSLWLQVFRQMRNWFGLLSCLNRPWKQCTRSQSHNSSYNHNGQLNKNIPRYVLHYAPLVHLSSNEQFWPCDMAEHLLHVDPRVDYSLLRPGLEGLNLTNLAQLNKWDYGRRLYLQSKDDVETRPKWLSGRENIPSDLRPEYPRLRIFSEGGAAHTYLSDQTVLGQKAKSEPQVRDKEDTNFNNAETDLNRDGRQLSGQSRAPATLIVVQKEDGIVDAFWFFFYSYNLGNQVLVRFGNHVGDWEHTMVRFKNGKPKAVYYSEHFFGQAYTYEAVEKISNRPVTYSAIGTHAMYASAGTHQYILPLGLLHDITDRGPLWDPLLNVRMYEYNPASNQLSPGNYTPNAPIEWFYYNGHWGDKSYPLSDPRQYMFAGQYHYVDGPFGPRFKNLGRKGVCEHPQQRCVIKDSLDEDRIRRWRGSVDGEGLELDDEV